jgi:ADP-heptose:LPS heptosyltransferase
MQLKVKRVHGLGNVLMLLPVLLKAASSGDDVTLVTHPDWIEGLARWCPGLRFVASDSGAVYDLDALTRKKKPELHRTAEFAEALGVSGPFPLLGDIKPRFPGPLVGRYGGATLFAPEAGHAARIWPAAHATELGLLLSGSPLGLIGLDRSLPIPCDFDLRGKLSFMELLEVISSARCVISMDSAVLQIAMSLGIPVISIFGGIDPAYRVLPRQNARVLVSSIGCRPCNKSETCDGRYTCLTSIRPGDVHDALNGLADLRGMEILVAG